MATYTSDELGKFVIENFSLLQECHRLRDESAQLISLSRALRKESDLLRRHQRLNIIWADRNSAARTNGDDKLAETQDQPVAQISR
jgi:hypothetical protein